MTFQAYLDKFRKVNQRDPSVKEIAKKFNLSERAAVQMVHGYNKSRKRETADRKGSAVPALRVALFIVSGLTFMLSVYFTELWFGDTLHWIISYSMSLSLVVFMILSPTIVLYIKGFVKAPIYLSFAIALVFSMGSTVAGQYNKRSQAVDIVDTNNRALYSILEAEEADKVRRIEEMKQEKAIHLSTIQMLSTSEEARIENWQSIATERNKIEQYNLRIQQEEALLEGVRGNLKIELENGNTGETEVRVDFYTWIANLRNWKRSNVEFWISVLPAVFIDIISALCLNLALFIREK